jgi:aspartate-semialdehyde dehydrogenase
VSHVCVGINLPVSHLGQAGIEELSSQTRALFAMESPEAGVLPPRIAFNLVPLVSETCLSGASRYERMVEVDLLSLLSRPSPTVMVHAAWVPVFFGYSATLHAVCEEEVDLESLRGGFAAADGITLMDEPLPGGAPTPSTDAQDSDDIFTGRLRTSQDAQGHVGMWLVFDGLRLEATRMMDALENLIEKNRNSVLT